MKEKIKYFLITRDNIGKEFLSAAETITQKKNIPILPMTIEWHKSASEIKSEISKKIESILPEEKLIFLTESFGDLSTNYTIPFIEKGRVEIITGINLDMLVEILKSKKKEYSQVLKEIPKKGKNSIKILTDGKIDSFSKLIIFGIGSIPFELYHSITESEKTTTKKPFLISTFYKEEIIDIEEKFSKVLKHENDSYLVLVDKITSKKLKNFFLEKSKEFSMTVLSGINYPMARMAISNISKKEKISTFELLKIGRRNIKLVSELI